jgi:hypothetical protein
MGDVVRVSVGDDQESCMFPGAMKISVEGLANAGALVAARIREAF